MEDVRPVEGGLSAVRLGEADDAASHRGLPAAGFTYQPDDLLAVHGQADAVQRHDPPATDRERLLQIDDRQQFVHVALYTNGHAEPCASSGASRTTGMSSQASRR